jgi:hypothetical protein
MRRILGVAGVMIGLCAGAPSIAPAACTIDEHPSEPHGPFIRHLGSECTEQERLAKAVAAEDLLSALKQGREIDLSGVIVTGDLSMDRLQAAPSGSLDSLPPSARQVVAADDLQDLRVVAVPISIRDSKVRGGFVSGMRKGHVVFLHPLKLTGTTFQRMLDLSRSVFVSEVDCSDTVFLREGFFIQSVFLDRVLFERATFGTHSRFHRARFTEPVSFFRSGFNGLAEFLEVSFERDAGFSRTYFKMGTGFSGTRFGGRLDFSEAVVEREIYFLFSSFEGDASFQRTAFRSQVDFSDAEFHGAHDFLRADFALEPQFRRTKSKGPLPTRQGLLQDPTYWYGGAASLLVFAVLLLVLRKR